mgnify:CR=1 FL=1
MYKNRIAGIGFERQFPNMRGIKLISIPNKYIIKKLVRKEDGHTKQESVF